MNSAAGLVELAINNFYEYMKMEPRLYIRLVYRGNSLSGNLSITLSDGVTVACSQVYLLALVQLPHLYNTDITIFHS